ncbi:MAG: chemotaxis response regulator protein-glutamate methylesterase [Spirochaetota bacterium]|nr:chemotaxis response regulator protein-glutamate methylesterase [Spirochaetota bacterium]
MKKIKVMVVDDSALVRETIGGILIEDPDIELFATAQDPIVAMRKMEGGRPDVMILDIEMPRMDGLTFLNRIMNEHPLPVIICSSKSETGSTNALKAMEYGAIEIIQKPKLGTKQFLEESKVLITDTVKAAAQAKMNRLYGRRPADEGAEEGRTGRTGAAGTAERSAANDRLKKHSADVILQKVTSNYTIETTEKVIVVGASTGGTEALKIFLEMMPLNAPPIVIVQHMPEKFTTAFAQRLNTSCKITVKEARNNDSVLRGQALIAPGNKHTLLKRSGARYYTEVKEGPLVSRHRPSVDVLFRSASRYGGKNVIAVLMTGMGDDGANGMVELKQTGAYTIAQDEKSCVVFGMPKEAIKRGGVDDVVSLERIAIRVLEKAVG